MGSLLAEVVPSDSLPEATCISAGIADVPAKVISPDISGEFDAGQLVLPEPDVPTAVDEHPSICGPGSEPSEHDYSPRPLSTSDAAPAPEGKPLTDAQGVLDPGPESSTLEFAMDETSGFPSTQSAPPDDPDDGGWPSGAQVGLRERAKVDESDGDNSPSALEISKNLTVWLSEPEPAKIPTAVVGKSRERTPVYRGLEPVRPMDKAGGREENIRKTSGTDGLNRESEASILLHLIFNSRGDGVRTLALVADWRRGMPAELEVSGTQGDFEFVRLQDDRYQDVTLPDMGSGLRSGIEWRGRDAEHRKWRWVLGGRELYVLIPGNDIGLSGFVSAARLSLNQEHLVLATMSLQKDVLDALADAGCPEPLVLDQSYPGVPPGWLLFRRVRPTRAVPSRSERDILNALCPVADIKPQFAGGIRLESRTWLLGHPPRIQFAGQIEREFVVKIDGIEALLSDSQSYEAPGWDAEGTHELWFADQRVSYGLRGCKEEWQVWNAYDLGTGESICGAYCHHEQLGRRWKVRVPSQNPVLVGAEPGQIFICQPRQDLHTATGLALVPFEPVWALPRNPAHLDKRHARVVPVGAIEPVRQIRRTTRHRGRDRAIAEWSRVIADAGRKGLAVSTGNEQAIALWRSYRAEAKRLWKAMR